MAIRRFNLEIDGDVKPGLLFDSEIELEAHLVDHGGGVASSASCARAAPPVNELPDPRRGRPSYGKIIAAAISAVGHDALARCVTPKERERLVQRQIAKVVGPNLTPCRRTIGRHLTSMAVRQKSRQK